MHWLLLVVAICFEVFGTVNMKLSKGFTVLVPSILIFVFYALSFVFLTMVLKKIDVSITYAIWSGLGTTLVAVIGFVWFREPVSALKILFLLMIVIGVVGLYMIDTSAG